MTISYDARDRYMHDLAYTLACRRSSLPWRSFVVTRSVYDLISIDQRFSASQQGISSTVMGFIFTRQGIQWAGRGEYLMRYPILERSLREAEGSMAKLGCG